MKSKSRILVACCALLLVSACTPKFDDLVVYTEQVKSNTQPEVEPYPEFTSQPAFIYSAQDLRSPFSRPKATTTPVIAAEKANCLQPDFERVKEPLEGYGIDALTLTGSFTAAGSEWVLFKTNDGNLYQATLGNHIGLFFGRISSINKKTVVLEELVPDGAGCWQRKETTLTMGS